MDPERISFQSFKKSDFLPRILEQRVTPLQDPKPPLRDNQPQCCAHGRCVCKRSCWNFLPVSRSFCTSVPWRALQWYFSPSDILPPSWNRRRPWARVNPCHLQHKVKKCQQLRPWISATTTSQFDPVKMFLHPLHPLHDSLHHQKTS